MTLLSRLLSLALMPMLAWGPLQAQSAEGLQIRVEGAAGSAVGQARTDFLIQVTNAAGLPVSDAAVTVRLPEEGASGVFSDGKRTSVAYTDQSGRTLVNGIQWNSVAGTAAIKVTATKGTAHAGILLEQVVSAPVVVAKSIQPEKAVQTPRAPAQLKEAAAAPAVEIASTPAQKPKLAPPSGLIDREAPVNPIASPAEPPQVSVTGAPDVKSHHGGRTKWIVLAVVAAGAAGGLAVLAGKSKSSSSSSTSASSSLSIGTPTVSVGHP